MKRSLILLLLVASAGTAYGQAAVCPATTTACNDPSEVPNPINVLTADTQENLLKALGKRLRPTGGPHTQMTIVYRNSSSCANVSSFFAGTQITTGTMSFIPANANWNEATPCTCTVTVPTTITLSSSAIFTESCGQTKPSTVGIFRGPLQAYNFVVRKDSSQRATTADEQYLAWGFGNQSQVTPWNNESFMFGRPQDASTLICTMENVGVSPPSKAKGYRDAVTGLPPARSGDVLTLMTAVTSPDEATIGLLGAAPYDRERGAANRVRALALKASGQIFAYYQDSTATAFDKRNMREGRFLSWSVTDWLANIGGGTTITDANTAYLVDMILDKPVTPAPAFDPLDSVMATGLVPACAMKVTRSAEAGPLSLYQSPTPCNCAFDKKFAPASAAAMACVACVDDTPCGAGKCRHLFCEPR